MDSATVTWAREHDVPYLGTLLREFVACARGHAALRRQAVAGVASSSASS